MRAAAILDKPLTWECPLCEEAIAEWDDCPHCGWKPYGEPEELEAEEARLEALRDRDDSNVDN